MACLGRKGGGKVGGGWGGDGGGEECTRRRGRGVKGDVAAHSTGWNTEKRKTYIELYMRGSSAMQDRRKNNNNRRNAAKIKNKLNRAHTPQRSGKRNNRPYAKPVHTAKTTARLTLCDGKNRVTKKHGVVRRENARQIAKRKKHMKPNTQVGLLKPLLYSSSRSSRLSRTSAGSASTGACPLREAPLRAATSLAASRLAR